MYSYNDWRSYEFYHASAFPGKGFIKGKNTPEYNKWYYMTHPEKWGITKAAVGMYDKAKDAVNDFVENTDTDLDNQALDLARRGKNAIGRGINKALSKTTVDDNISRGVKSVRASTEALQRRDSANRQAQDYSQKAANARKIGANKQAEKYEAAAGRATRTAQNAQSQFNSTATGRGLRRASDAVGNVKTAVSNTGRRILDSTTIDDNIVDAGRNLAKGNFRGARDAAKRVGYEAGSMLRGAGQRVLNSTDLDDRAIGAARSAGTAVRNAVRGATGLSARDVANDPNASQAARDAANRSYQNSLAGRADAAGRALRTGAGAVAGGAKTAVDNARDLGRRALDATTIDESLGRAASNFAKGNFKAAGANVRNAGREAGEVIGNAARATGRRILDSTNIDENNRQIAEQGYRYGQALANAQREYDASPNPNSKRMLDIAQRDYDNYTKGNRVAQIGAAAGRAGKSLNNAMNDVQRAVGNQVESIRDRNAAARDLETARENEANARSNYNELARQSSNARGRMMDRAEETGDPVSAQNAYRDEISRRDARADEARENIPAAQRQTREAEGRYNRAQDRYDQTPLGRAENTARNLKNSAGSAVEAKIEATRAVKDAVSDYWDAVDQYGANSPQAKAAARAAEGKMSSAAVGIIGRFGNAKNTIEGVIEDGQEWLDSLIGRNK